MNDIQRIILDIYKEVKKICEKHNISYFALGGTCIGAVRHAGFIPWDDDLDIAIPIEQYSTFIRFAKNELPSYLKVVTPFDSKHNDCFFIKVINTNTTMIESRFMPYPDMYGGVWLDIFPLAGIPKPGKERDSFYKKGIWLEYINKRICRNISNVHSVNGKIFSFFLSPLKLFPAGFIWNIWFSELKKHLICESDFTGHVWEEKMLRLTFPIDYFKDYVDLPFENTVMRCPIGYHEYLTQVFGNYMQWPPENSRNSGHDFDEGIIDLDTSYEIYAEKKRQRKNEKMR